MAFLNTIKKSSFIVIVCSLFFIYDAYSHNNNENEDAFSYEAARRFIRVNPTNNSVVMGPESMHNTSLFAAIDPWDTWTKTTINHEHAAYYKSFHALIDLIPSSIMHLNITLYTEDQARALSKFTCLQTLCICIDQTQLLKENTLEKIKGSDVLWCSNARLEAAIKVFLSKLYAIKNTCYPWARFVREGI